LLQSRSKVTPWNERSVRGLPIHTLVRGRFVMRERALVSETRGWGRSVHTLQRLPDAAPRNVDQTMEAIVRGGDVQVQSEKAKSEKAA
jgi:dihydroorotase